MRRRALVFVVAAISALASPSVAHAQSTPTITVSIGAATVGQPVAVTGQGFPPKSPISVQLCGNEARNGSTDCDVVAGQTVVSDESGAFTSQVVVRFPPVPCPCVVWASSNSATAADATAPLGVVTATSATPTAPANPIAPARPELEVVRATLRPRAAWREWLGLPSTADLVLTLKNPGKNVVAHPVLSLTMGRGSDPSSVVTVPDIGAVNAGEQRDVLVPVHLDALSLGRYTVKGTLGTGATVEFRAHVTVVPYALFGIVVLFGVVTLFVMRTRHRRRRRDAGAGREGATVVEPVIELEPEPVTTTPLVPVRVTFTYPSWVRVDSVALCGEFNDWSTTSHPMARTAEGTWAVVVELEPERSYRYRFFIDGERWDNDWAPDQFVYNDFGSHDSVVVVGATDRYANTGENARRRTPYETFLDIDLPDLGRSDDFWADEPAPVADRVRGWWHERSGKVPEKAERPQR